MTVGLIKTGFQKNGIFSLDRRAIDASRYSDNSSNSPPPSSNSTNPNPPTSPDEDTSIISLLMREKLPRVMKKARPIQAIKN